MRGGERDYFDEPVGVLDQGRASKKIRSLNLNKTNFRTRKKSTKLN